MYYVGNVLFKTIEKRLYEILGGYENKRNNFGCFVQKTIILFQEKLLFIKIVTHATGILIKAVTKGHIFTLPNIMETSFTSCSFYLKKLCTIVRFIDCAEDDDDDDDLIMEEPNVITTPPSRKRKANGASDADVSAKKPKHSGDTTCQDDDIVIL